MAEHLLQHTDNLSKTLQNPELTVVEGERTAQLTRSTLQQMRDSDYFDLFWERVLKLQEEFEINEPTLPRKRKAPTRLEDGTAEPEFHCTP